VVLADGSPIGTVTIGKGARPPVGSIIEVGYLYCQAALVQAVFKCIRTDVERSACTRSQLQFKSGVDPMARLISKAELEQQAPELKGRVHESTENAW
jgi:hypothetical protein